MKSSKSEFPESIPHLLTAHSHFQAAIPPRCESRVFKTLQNSKFRTMDRDHRRRFGQNFLDAETAELLASDIPLSPGDSILEIGPGHGALTGPLLSRGVPVTAVEIDRECVGILQEKFSANPHFHLVNQDFLKFPIDEWLRENPKPWLAGNLPYNVSTGIVAKVMPMLHKTHGFMCMVQYEVAERLCAEPHSRNYGSLSVWIRAHATGKILRKIGPEHFVPKPNVDSATILLSPRKDPLNAPAGFFDFVQLAFSQKRKVIANPLASRYEKKSVFEALELCGFSKNARAEELSPENLCELYIALNP